MGTLSATGTNGGVLKYTDDDNNVLRIVISQIITYSRASNGHIRINTAKGRFRLDLGTKANVTAAINLIDSKF